MAFERSLPSTAARSIRVFVIVFLFCPTIGNSVHVFVPCIVYPDVVQLHKRTAIFGHKRLSLQNEFIMFLPNVLHTSSLLLLYRAFIQKCFRGISIVLVFSAVDFNSKDF